MKRRVLYIINGLQRAGAEKYLHDLILAIDKSKFDVEVLTSDDVHKNKIFPHYYYFRLKERGVKVRTFLLPKFNEFSRTRNYLSNKAGFLQKMFDAFAWGWNGMIATLHTRKLKRFFRQYDYVSVIDALSFHIVKKALRKSRNYDVHLMCHQCQFDNQVYKAFDKGLAYNVVYIDPNQLLEMKEQGLRIGRRTYFPLSINVNDYPQKYSLPTDLRSFRIGIFTRISRTKPLDVFLTAFRLLKSSTDADVYLHIFGHKQDQEYFSKLEESIAAMNLQNNVVFEGHSENMLRSIEHRQINLVWGLSVAGFVGYATVEIGAVGLPIVLNSLEKFENVPLDDPDHVPPYFYSPEKLSQFTKQFLEGQTEELGGLIKEHFISQRNLEKNVKNYEQYLVEAIGQE